MVTENLLQKTGRQSHERFFEESRGLNEGLITLVDAIEIFLKGPEVREEAERGYKGLHYYSIAPHGSSVLRIGFELLHSELSRPEGETEKDLGRAFRAVLIADALVTETSLPLTKRSAIKGKRVQKKAEQYDSPEPDPDVLLLADQILEKANQLLVKARTVIESSAQDDESLQRSFLYADAINKVQYEAITPLWRSFHSREVASCLKALEIDSTKPVSAETARQYINKFGLSTLTSEWFRTYVWTKAWHNRDLFLPASEDTFYQRRAEDLFSDPATLRLVWVSFIAMRGSPLNVETINRVKGRLDVSSLHTQYPFVEWLLNQGEEIATKFVETFDIPNEVEPGDFELAARRLVEIFAVYKTVFPQNISNDAYERLVGLVEEKLMKRGGLQKELEILTDRVPGGIGF